MDGFDPRAVDLRHVGGVHEHERGDPPEHRRFRDIGEVERRGAEAQDVDDEDRRDAPEEVGVEHRQRAEREQHRARQAPQHGDPQRHDEDQGLGGQEDADVDEKLPCDLRERLAEDLAVEERAAHIVPARRVDDREGDEPEDDDGAREGDDGAAGAAGGEVAEDPRPAAFAAGLRVDAHAGGAT
jgi:hypothetical protein